MLEVRNADEFDVMIFLFLKENLELCKASHSVCQFTLGYNDAT